MSNKILTSVQNNSLIVKYCGNIQVPISLTLTDSLKGKINSSDYAFCYFDLTEVEHMDSTALGLTAKIGFEVRRQTGRSPILVCENPDILRLFESLGLFKKVFNVIKYVPSQKDEFIEEKLVFPDEDDARQLIIDAHQLLIDIDVKNHKEFQCVIDSFKQDEANKAKIA